MAGVERGRGRGNLGARERVRRARGKGIDISAMCTLATVPLESVLKR